MKNEGKENSLETPEIVLQKKDLQTRQHLLGAPKDIRVVGFFSDVMAYTPGRFMLTNGAFLNFAVYDAAFYWIMKSNPPEVLLDKPMFWPILGVLSVGTAGSAMALGGLAGNFYRRFYKNFFDVK